MEKVREIVREGRRVAKDDPRRVVHSFKVGLVLALVSSFYYYQPLYDSFGVNAMWAVMTVVVVFEFSVGATLGKGLNRVGATLFAGALGIQVKGLDPSKHSGNDVTPSTLRLRKKRHQGSPAPTTALLLMTLCLAIRATSTPVLTIKSPDGDLIDCVERAAQPAFSHPLLKNHKFQERPTNFPNMENNEDAVSWQIWHGSGTQCPEGTIPIRRVISHNVSTTVSESGVEATLGHEYAIGSTHSTTNIYGTKATMSVWHPKVERAEEFSLGQIWVVSGSYENNDVNTMEAGWQVYPEIYYDYQPRFFIFWTNDAYNRTRCYNLRCDGFIQTSRTILIEGAISPASTFGGAQTELTIQIWKDPKLSVWWLGVGLNNGTVLAPVGYWPTEIFTRLTDSADRVQWGGEIVNKNISGRHTTTEMGSGYLPGAKAAYMRDLEIAVNVNYFQPVYDLVVVATNPTYYRIKKSSSTSFFYGGPEHAGAVHLRLESILLYLYFGIFLLF